jgi:hypothetical protein
LPNTGQMQNASTISSVQKVGSLLKQTLPLRAFYSFHSINGITAADSPPPGRSFILSGIRFPVSGLSGNPVKSPIILLLSHVSRLSRAEISLRI